MKIDEDLAYDRGIEVQTDDEDDRAERVWNHIDDDSESDVAHYSRKHSASAIETCLWPQSIRNSMDMLTITTPPSSGFLNGRILKPMISLLFKVTNKSKIAEIFEDDSSLSKPLTSEIISMDNEDQVPTSVPPLKLSLSSNEMPSTHDGQCSYAQSVLNGINILCGIGLLTTPYAVREGGWLGLTLLLMFGVMTCYTGILMKRCLESVPGLKSYPDIGEAAFGFAGRLTISTVLYMELYAACVEYITMIGDNLAFVFPTTSMYFAGMKFDSHQVFAISATLLIIPTVWLRNLSLLSYLSVGGVGASVLVALCLLWAGVVNQVGFHPSGKVLDLANLPVAIGIYGYGFSGHPVFPSIYSSMKEPQLFPYVLVTSFVFCFFLYTGVAIIGYLMFGDTVKSQFTLNMPNQLVASKIAVWTTVVNPFAKYALTITPVTWSLEELLPMALREYYIISIVLRTIIVMSTLVVALRVPFFGSVMALVGSMLAMLVAIFFPCACYISIFRNKLKRSEIAVCIIMMMTSMVCSCIGTYSAIKRIAGQMG